MMRRPYWLLLVFGALVLGMPVGAGLFDTGELVAAAWQPPWREDEPAGGSDG